MSKHQTRGRCLNLMAASLLALAVGGCGSGGSGTATPGALRPPPGAVSGPAALAAATSLTINITRVTVNARPVVDFTVTNQAGVGMAGFGPADLRFNIAKLVPGSNGEPGNWQNYINRNMDGAVQGSQEQSAPGFVFGTLVDHQNGTYAYTFGTDIAGPAANPCLAPCTDADGKALDIGYQPGLTHRVTIQQGNRAYPKATGVLDFVPAGTAGSQRDIVLTSTCNQCHHELSAHGTRVETKLCVSCHNPGSWVAGAPNTTVDFKVMIHKIHRGAALPSVLVGTPYKIGSADFSDVVYTQDVRNCTRCHDGVLGAQGDNWKTQPSMEACGSCHDDVYFSAQPDLARPYQTVAHSGGIMTDNSTCLLCHGAGRVADVTVAHDFPARLKAAARFKFNIISATPTAPGGFPVITFSVTDPSNGDRPYDILTDAPFRAGAASTLSIELGWTRSGIADIGNDGSGQNFGQPISINALTAAVPGSAVGTYAVTSTVPIPASQTGTLRVMMDGHPAGDVTTPGVFTDRLAVTSVFRDFAITGTAVARRLVVDIAKCNVCHDVLSLHGANRTDEPGVCAVCHNPNATDAGRRPATGGVLTGGIDGKLEEAIDFKTMIHGIHAGQASNGGFREEGLVVYGFGGSVNDYGKVVFPGILSNCTACHTSSSYQLAGIWASPTANGILGTTTATGASPGDAADNLRITPTAAVCSSCHDRLGPEVHMTGVGGGQFSVTQAAIDGSAPEICQICHGPGGPVDVKAVHQVK